MNTSAAIADLLLRRAFCRPARPLNHQRTVRVQWWSSGPDTLVPRRGSRISPWTVWI